MRALQGVARAMKLHLVPVHLYLWGGAGAEARRRVSGNEECGGRGRTRRLSSSTAGAVASYAPTFSYLYA